MNKQNTTLEYKGPGTPAAPREPGFVIEFLSSLKTSIISTLVLAIIVSGAYPLIVWGLAQVIFHNKANGSLIDKNGQLTSNDADAVGSALLGQGFAKPEYFHPRSSLNSYDGSSSSGTNLGPTSLRLMCGATKNFALTVFAADKTRSAIVPVSGRVQGAVSEVTKTTITVTAQGATAKTTYTLDPTIADPNTIVSFHGRTIHATTITPGAIVELKLNDKTPPVVTGISVVDQEVDGVSKTIDTNANKITLSDSSGTVIVVDPSNTVFVVNGKADAKLTDMTTDLTIHAVVSLQVDYDGIADRVIHYCQDNTIAFTSTIPAATFTDADGIDDVKLIAAFNGATMPTITPGKPVPADKVTWSGTQWQGNPDHVDATPIPADAVTSSGSGMDPHISGDNAALQAQRVADARKVKLDQVKALIARYTDARDLGLLGEAGVNVLRLNLALDKELPVPAAAPATPPTTVPATTPATRP